MATTSEIGEIIRCNPIKERLAPFRRRFESIRLGLGLPSSPNVVQTVFLTAATADAKSLVLDLIKALLIEPAAHNIPSRISDRSVCSDLIILYSRVLTDQSDITAAIPLVELIVKNEPDEPTWNDSDIWHAVFELATAPFTAFGNHILDTPLRSSSTFQSWFEQIHDDIGQQIREDFTGRVYGDVKGFYERYFEGKTWTQKAKDIYEQSKIYYADNRWVGWPEHSSEKSFYEWFIKFQNIVLSHLGRRYTANYRKIDTFLTLADVAVLNEWHWSNVLVIGELKRNPNEDRSTRTLVQLARYAREVFISQPNRRFVPGFTICGSVMRLWVFDRSGPYSSEKFDINKQPERFIQVIAGYALMTDAELGLDTFIRRDGDKYIVAQGMRIYMEDKPFAWSRAIVSRGTACYRGRKKDSERWEYVVKLSWPSEKRDREGDMLKLAKDRGVKGIAEWVHHEQINVDGQPETIRHLRRGMEFGAPRMLTGKAPWAGSDAGSIQALWRTQSLREKSRSSKVSANSTKVSPTGQKRKRDESIDDNGGMKRSKLGDSRTDVEVATDAERAEPEPTYENRIHCCLVVSPPGRPLNAYRSTKELLEALRDAVSGHRSLLEDGKILHQDISENNIIITEAASKGEPAGRLIDLDMAEELDGKSSGASHRTGTVPFMAIGVLIGEDHTYRHDLESFFYVFIWMCICYGHDDMDDGQATRKKSRHSRTSALQDWYTGDYRRAADRKVGHMDGNVFERSIIGEFPPRFDNLKELARDLRDVLFPESTDGALFTETLSDHNVMYDGIIEAFNRVIASVENEDQKEHERFRESY